MPQPLHTGSAHPLAADMSYDVALRDSTAPTLPRTIPLFYLSILSPSFAVSVASQLLSDLHLPEKLLVIPRQKKCKSIDSTSRLIRNDNPRMNLAA